MGQRNRLCTCQFNDLEMDQQGLGRLHPEPCVLGSQMNFSPPNIRTMLPAPGNPTNFDVHHLQERQDNALFYGRTQYNAVQHHHPAANLDLGVATVSHYCDPFMIPSSSTSMYPVPVSQRSHDQLPSSSNGGAIGASTNNYGRNSHFIDGIRGSFKRKNAEAIQGNFQYCVASGGSSSSVVPPDTRPVEPGVAMMDATSFAMPTYRGNDVPSFMEVASQRSVRNRAGAIGMDTVLAHNASHLIQGNYMGQPLHMASTPWLDQQFGCNGSDGNALTLNPAPALTYLHGCNLNGGCIEAGNMGLQVYHETAINRNPTNFLHFPPIHLGNNSLHHAPPPPPMQGARGHDINFRPQMASSSHRLSTNSAFQDGLDAGPRYVGPVPPSGLRIYRPQRREVIHESTSRQRNLPYLRVLPADEVAILEMSGYYEVGNFADHYRDMRLDIDHMSYEELLALGEQIGNVGTGLSEETITSYLKTRTYLSSPTCINLEETGVDLETDFCVICQSDYKNEEKIGILDCGHEYHADCVKKWLIVKNACPICKCSALTIERKEH